MKLLKGEILRFKEGHKLPGYEKNDYCVVIYTGDFETVPIIPSDRYGQYKEANPQPVHVSTLERTGQLIWEFDRTLFPHIIELLKEYYKFAIGEEID